MTDYIMFDDGTQLDASVGSTVNLSDRYEEDTGTTANSKILKAETTGLTRKTITAYFDGMPVEWLNTTANTGAATINVISLGSKDIRKKDGSALSGGELPANTQIQLYYVAGSGHFRILKTSVENLSVPVTVATGGTGRTSHTAYGVICGGATTTGAQQSIAAVGTSGQVLTSNGPAALPTFQFGSSSSIIQKQHVQTNTYSSSSATIPSDDTIPQNTEGVEIFTLAITPTSATNDLLIEAVMCLGITGTAASFDFTTIAVFKDSGSNAIAAATARQDTIGSSDILSLTYKMTSGTTSAITFKMRCGNTTHTIYINGRSGARVLGGSMYSSMTITEIG